MCKIWENQLSPKALKSYPKNSKSPNLVTLAIHHIQDVKCGQCYKHSRIVNHDIIGKIGHGNWPPAYKRRYIGPT